MTGYCNISQDILKEYPSSAEIVFVTKVSATIGNTLNAWITELQKGADSTSTPEMRELVPLRDVSSLLKKKVFVESIEFSAIDTTIDSGDGQDAGVATEVNAVSTSNDNYPRSQFRYSVLPIRFQPNYFYFDGKINNKSLIAVGNEPNAGNNISDLSIGHMLPRCIGVEQAVESFESISLRARFAQYVSGQNKYLNYPVHAVMKVRMA